MCSINTYAYYLDSANLGPCSTITYILLFCTMQGTQEAHVGVHSSSSWDGNMISPGTSSGVYAHVHVHNTEKHTFIA